MGKHGFAFLVLTAFAGTTAIAGDDFQDYTDYDSFRRACPGLICVDFTEVPVNTVLNDQYAHCTFVDGDDVVVVNRAFERDEVGVNGQGQIAIQLAQPSKAIGCYFPGGCKIELYDRRGGRKLYTSQNFGGTGTGFFAGVCSQDTVFEYAVLSDWTDGQCYIDDFCVSDEDDDELCPAESLLAGETRNLDQLRRFRDEFVSATPEGLEVVKAYYALSPEVVVHLALDSQVRSDALSLLKTFRPAVANMLGEKGGHPVKLTDARLAQVERVTQRLARTGSPHLRSTVTKLNKTMQAHKNRSFAEFCHAIVDEGI